MERRNKPNLSKALKRVDKMPDYFFGNIDINTLPCMQKVKKEKITANFDKSLLAKIRETATQHNVPYTELMNDVLCRVFMHKHKA